MRVSLTVRFFDRDLDLPVLNGWLRAHDHQEMERNHLPPIGVFVLEDDETPVAACFLRRCEGLMGVIDGLATNPECSSTLRHVAIDTAVRVIIEQAKIYGIRALIAWSQDAGTLARASQTHGFKKLPDTMIVKEIEEPFTH